MMISHVAQVVVVVAVVVVVVVVVFFFCFCDTNSSFVFGCRMIRRLCLSPRVFMFSQIVN